MLEEAAVLNLLSQSSIVRLLSLESLPSYHYLVLEVRHGAKSKFHLAMSLILRQIPTNGSFGWHAISATGLAVAKVTAALVSSRRFETVAKESADRAPALP